MLRRKKINEAGKQPLPVGDRGEPICEDKRHFLTTSPIRRRNLASDRYLSDGRLIAVYDDLDVDPLLGAGDPGSYAIVGLPFAPPCRIPEERHGGLSSGWKLSSDLDVA